MTRFHVKKIHVDKDGTVELPEGAIPFMAEEDSYMRTIVWFLEKRVGPN